MLGREVSLIDIKRWFPTPTSQKMSVSDELSALLGDKGLSWPPNANCFEQCTIYRRVKCSGESMRSTSVFQHEQHPVIMLEHLGWQSSQLS